MQARFLVAIVGVGCALAQRADAQRSVSAMSGRLEARAVGAASGSVSGTDVTCSITPLVATLHLGDGKGFAVGMTMSGKRWGPGDHTVSPSFEHGVVTAVIDNAGRFGAQMYQTDSGLVTLESASAPVVTGRFIIWLTRRTPSSTGVAEARFGLEGTFDIGGAKCGLRPATQLAQQSSPVAGKPIAIEKPPVPGPTSAVHAARGLMELEAALKTQMRKKDSLIQWIMQSPEHAAGVAEVRFLLQELTGASWGDGHDGLLSQAAKTLQQLPPLPPVKKPPASAPASDAKPLRPTAPPD